MRLDLPDPPAALLRRAQARGDLLGLRPSAARVSVAQRFKPGRPWKLCFNDACPSMEEMKRKRAEREAAKAAKEGAASAAGDGDAAESEEAIAEAEKIAVQASATKVKRARNGAGRSRGTARARAPSGARARSLARAEPVARIACGRCSSPSRESTAPARPTRRRAGSPRRSAPAPCSCASRAAPPPGRGCESCSRTGRWSWTRWPSCCSSAPRAQLVAEVINPAREAGRDVVCDRFSDSTIAYQGVARGLGADKVESLCDIATRGVWPDLALFLRLHPEVAAERIAAEGPRRRPLRGGGAEAAEAGRRGIRGGGRAPPRARADDRRLAAARRGPRLGGRRARARPRRRCRLMALAEAALPAALAEATRHGRAPGPRWGRRWRPGPPTRTSSGARPGRASGRRRGPSRPSCWHGAPTPRARGGAPCSIPRRTPTSSSCARPAPRHLVDDVRQSVIRAASLRPVEGERRVFVIEEAEGLRDESQNALLKTLEEPAGFAHLILVCSEPELLAGTILSRCQAVEFAPLAPEAVTEALGASGPEADAVARLCEGRSGARPLPPLRLRARPAGRRRGRRARRLQRP